MKALILNGSLKSDPKKSNTEKVIKLVKKELETYDIEVETLYLRDIRVSPGVDFEVDDPNDEAEIIFEKIKESDIIIFGTPIWWGIHSSLIQAVMERVGSFDDQYIKEDYSQLYGKTFGMIITASNDGFQHIIGLLNNFAVNLGFTVPPENYVTWGTVLEFSKGGKDPKKNKETVNMIQHMSRNLFYWTKALKGLDLGKRVQKIKGNRVGVLSNDELDV